MTDLIQIWNSHLPAAVIAHHADVSGVFQGQMKVSLDSHIPGRRGEVTHDDTQNPMLPGMTQDENVAAESEAAIKEEQEEKKS